MPEERQDLETFKKELLLFLRESAQNLEKNAKAMPIATQGDRYKVLEKVNFAIAHINLAIMIERDVFG